LIANWWKNITLNYRYNVLTDSIKKDNSGITGVLISQFVFSKHMRKALPLQE